MRRGARRGRAAHRLREGDTEAGPTIPTPSSRPRAVHGHPCARRRTVAVLRAGALVLALLSLALAAGCGDGSLAARTTPLMLDTQVSPRQYLADTVAAADAVRQFSDALATVGPRPAPAALERVARDLADPLVAGRRLLDRFEAARLEDSRLERQRERVAEALRDVVSAMERTRDAAVVGDPARVAQESRGFASAVARLRALPEP